MLIISIIFSGNLFYEICLPDGTHIFNIREDNGFIKFLDSFLSEIPFANLFSGFFFNPTYSISRLDGTKEYSLSKKPSLLSREFILEDTTGQTVDYPELVLLSLIQMICLERTRG
ncbi:MAG: hypothetical protein ACRCXZ_05030 [Patescibacteria group bacterium]